METKKNSFSQQFKIVETVQSWTEIKKHIDNFDNNIEAIDYLHLWKKKYKQYLSEPFNFDLDKANVLDKIELELEYLEGKQKRLPDNRADKKKEKEVELIRWEGTLLEIEKVFEALYNHGKLIESQYKKRKAIIAQHFCDPEGEPLKQQSLKKTASRDGKTTKGCNTEIAMDSLIISALKNK